MIILVLVIVLVLVYFFTVSSKIINTACAEEARARVINIVNESNDILRTYDFFYANFFDIHRDSDGNIDAITANSPLINQVNMLIQTEIQNKLNVLREIDVWLPAGVLTGSAYLSKFGIPIRFKVSLMPNCYTVIRSIFSGLRINQTLHRLQIDCIAEIKIVAPFGTYYQEVTNEITIAETVIVGKVPDTFIDSNSSAEYYPLLP